MMVYGGICRHGKMSDMPNSSARLNKIEVFESRGFQDGLNLAKRSFDTQKKAHFTGDRAGYVAMWLG